VEFVNIFIFKPGGTKIANSYASSYNSVSSILLPCNHKGN